MDQPYSLDGIVYKKFKRPISPIAKISKIPKIQILNYTNYFKYTNKRKMNNIVDSNKFIKIN